MNRIRYTRIYCGPDGESHFDELSVVVEAADYAPPASPLNLAEPIASERLIFCSLPRDWIGAWHPTPRRQFYFQMSGRLKVTVSDGEEREFYAGSVVLLEDTSGRGHFTQTIGDEEVKCAFVQLPASDQVAV